MSTRIHAVLASLPLVVACGGGPTDPEDIPTPVRDASLALQTDGLRYELRVGDSFWEAEIPFSFTNPTDDSVYVVGCRGPSPPSLQRLEDGKWVLGWDPLVFNCLDLPPFSIGPRERYSGTLFLVAAFPDAAADPKFVFDPPDGIYRLVWMPRASFDERTPGFGPLLPLEQRISNSFALVRPG